VGEFFHLREVLLWVRDSGKVGSMERIVVRDREEVRLAFSSVFAFSWEGGGKGRFLLGGGRVTLAISSTV